MLHDNLEEWNAVGDGKEVHSSMDCIVHGVAKSRTRLSDFHLIIIEVFDIVKRALN